MKKSEVAHAVNLNALLHSMQLSIEPRVFTFIYIYWIRRMERVKIMKIELEIAPEPKKIMTHFR